MHNRASLALAVAIMLCSGGAVYAASGWPWKAALFPLVIGIPLFFMAAAEAAWVLFGRDKAARAMDFQIASDVPQATAVRRTLLAAAWMLGFFALIALVSFPVAVPLFVLLYLRLQGREPWLFSIVFSAAVWALFYAIFKWLLNLPFPAGWLQSLAGS